METSRMICHGPNREELGLDCVYEVSVIVHMWERGQTK